MAVSSANRVISALLVFGMSLINILNKQGDPMRSCERSSHGVWITEKIRLNLTLKILFLRYVLKIFIKGSGKFEIYKL